MNKFSDSLIPQIEHVNNGFVCFDKFEPSSTRLSFVLIFWTFDNLHTSSLCMVFDTSRGSPDVDVSNSCYNLRKNFVRK